jgi:hypothetical protein
MIRILLRHNAERPSTASHVETPVWRIIEQIIGIADARHSGDLLARLGIQHQEQGRCTDADKQAMMGLVQGHGEMGLGALEGPGRADSARVAIHHGDVVRGRDIHEDAWPRLLKLERFGMALQRNIPEVLDTRGVDETQCPRAVSDIEGVPGGIVAHIVRITGQLDGAAVLERGAIKEVARARVPIRDDNRVGFWEEHDSLRLVESRHRVQMRPCLQVDDLKGIVAQRGDEQPLALEVDRQVVNPPLDMG